MGAPVVLVLPPIW